jgi:hypothetical protein
VPELKPKVVAPAHGPLGDVTDLRALTDYLPSSPPGEADLIRFDPETCPNP